MNPECVKVWNEAIEAAAEIFDKQAERVERHRALLPAGATVTAMAGRRQADEIRMLKKEGESVDAT